MKLLIYFKENFKLFLITRYYSNEMNLQKNFLQFLKEWYYDKLIFENSNF